MKTKTMRSVNWLVCVAAALCCAAFGLLHTFSAEATDTSDTTPVSVMQYDRAQLNAGDGNLSLVAVIRLYTTNTANVTNLENIPQAAAKIKINGTALSQTGGEYQVHLMGDGIVVYSRTQFTEGGNILLEKGLPIAAPDTTYVLDEGFELVYHGGQWEHRQAASADGARTNVAVRNHGNLPGGTDLYVEFDNGYETNGLFTQRLAAVQYYISYKRAGETEARLLGDLNGVNPVAAPRYQIHQRRDAVYIHAPADALFAAGDEITLLSGMGFARVTEDAAGDATDPRHPWTVTGDRLGESVTFALNDSGVWVAKHDEELPYNTSVMQYDRTQLNAGDGNLSLVAVIRLYTTNTANVTNLENIPETAAKIKINGTALSQTNGEYQVHLLGDGIVVYSRTQFTEGGSIVLEKGLPLPKSRYAYIGSLSERFELRYKNGMWTHVTSAPEADADTNISVTGCGNLGGTDLYVEFDNGYETDGLFTQRLAAVQYYVSYKSEAHNIPDTLFGDLNGVNPVAAARYQMHQRKNAVYIHAPADALFAPYDEITLHAGMGFARVTEDAAGDASDPRHPWTATGDRLGESVTLVLNGNGEWVIKQAFQSVGLPDSLSLDIHAGYNLDPVITPENAIVKQITYASDDESVATVDGDGRISAVGVGECEITCTVKAADGDFTARVSVTVNDVLVRIALKEDSEYKKTYVQGEALNVQGLTVIKYMESGTAEEVEVTEEMLTGFTTQEVGEVTVFVTVDGKMTSFAITVVAPEKPKKGCGSALDSSATCLFAAVIALFSAALLCKRRQRA